MGLRVTSGHHVSFSVSDLARSRAFYEGVLGFAPIERPDFPFPGMWYGVGAIEVHLIVPPGAETDVEVRGPNPLQNHAAFAIESYEEAAAHLSAHGIPFSGLGPERGQLFLRDPDGNQIELIVADKGP